MGLAPMAGGTGAALTVKETGILTGVTPVPPLSVTVPLWVPTARAPVAAVTVTRPLPVPEPGLRVNQRCTANGGPTERAAAGVADGQGLGRGIPSGLSRKGQTGRAHGNGWTA